MSMLAERKRKTKWVINPTKQPLWAQDSTGIKFGKELMEKMGWSAGRGLGSREQGIQEPLRVSYKNDTKGMGFKGNDDDWIEHQDEFNILLSQLSNNGDKSAVKNSDIQKTEVKSLELKSKHSRARVHYQKFTRGKDLSNYSENDLACILGINKTKKEKAEIVTKTDEKGECEKSFGVTTINSGSIQDYFKKKWTHDKMKSIGFLFKTSKTEENVGNSCLNTKSVFSTNDEGNEKPNFEERRHKRLKHKSKADNPTHETTEDFERCSRNEELSIPNAENGMEERKHKRRKTKSESEPTEIEGTVECEVNKIIISQEKDKKKKNKLESDSEEMKNTKKKKSKKTGDNESKICISEDFERSHCSSNDEFLSAVCKEKNLKLKPEQKKSHKEKHKLKSEPEEIVQESTENLTVDDGSNFSEKRKTKEKKHKSNLATEASEETQRFLVCDTDKPSEEDDKRDEELVDIIGEEQKRKGRKRKHVIKDQFLDDGQVNTSHESKNCQSFHNRKSNDVVQEESSSALEVMEKKSKKRKHKSKSKIEEISTDDFSVSNHVFEQKKTKKKKHEISSEDEPLEKKDRKAHELPELTNCTDIISVSHVTEKKKHKKSCSREDPSKSKTAVSMDLNYEDTKNLSIGHGEDISSTKKRKKDKKTHPNPEIPEKDECFEAGTDKKKKKKKMSHEDCSKQDVFFSECNGEEIEHSHLNDASVKTPTNISEGGAYEETKPGKNWREKEISEGKENVEKPEKRDMDDRADEFICEDGSGGKEAEVSEVGGKEGMNMKARQRGEVINSKEECDVSPQHRYMTGRVLDLIHWADIKEFRGSNLGNVLGYGFKKEYLRTKMR